MSRGRAARDLSGQQFGRWTAIRPLGADAHGKMRWECRCECGAVKAVLGNTLTTGESLSCGCYKRDLNMDDLSGQTFGDVRVLNWAGVNSDSRKYSLWNCICNKCGAPFVTQGRYLTRGSVSSCGCGGPGFVYVISRPDGSRKIGLTTNPSKRQSNFRTAGLGDFDALIPVRWTGKAEKFLHEKFADQCVGGEWYALTDTDMAFVAALATTEDFGY